MSESIKRSKAGLWIGWILTGLVVAFFLLDATMKLIDVQPVKDASAQLGLPLANDRLLGLIGLIVVVLYAIPRTSVLGAILMTGYLGGAVATHLRIGSPLFSHILFGVYIGVMAWGGLYLRSPRLRALIPLVTTPG